MEFRSSAEYNVLSCLHKSRRIGPGATATRTSGNREEPKRVPGPLIAQKRRKHWPSMESFHTCTRSVARRYPTMFKEAEEAQHPCVLVRFSSKGIYSSTGRDQPVPTSSNRGRQRSADLGSRRQSESVASRLASQQAGRLNSSAGEIDFQPPSRAQPLSSPAPSTLTSSEVPDSLCGLPSNSVIGLAANASATATDLSGIRLCLYILDELHQSGMRKIFKSDL